MIILVFGFRPYILNLMNEYSITSLHIFCRTLYESDKRLFERLHQHHEYFPKVTLHESDSLTFIDMKNIPKADIIFIDAQAELLIFYALCCVKRNTRILVHKEENYPALNFFIETFKAKEDEKHLIILLNDSPFQAKTMRDIYSVSKTHMDSIIYSKSSFKFSKSAVKLELTRPKLTKSLPNTFFGKQLDKFHIFGQSKKGFTSFTQK